jgi:hypothetical protein
MDYYNGQDENKVTVNGEPLPLCTEIVNHSPTGFAWGYGGSGPSQLALAILVHHLKDKQEALRYYQDFKNEVVANLKGNDWVINSDDIEYALSLIRDETTLSLK